MIDFTHPVYSPAPPAAPCSDVDVYNWAGFGAGGSTMPTTCSELRVYVSDMATAFSPAKPFASTSLIEIYWFTSTNGGNGWYVGCAANMGNPYVTNSPGYCSASA